MTGSPSRLGRIISTCMVGALGAATIVPPAFADAGGGPSADRAPAASGTDPGTAAKPAATPNPSADTNAAPRASTTPGKPTPPVGTSAVVMDLSSSEGVIGHGVKSSAGEDMGRIVDLLVTMSGQVRAAVIDFGGILGVGSRKVAVDWRALDFSELPKGGDIRLLLTRNQVRVSPEYKSGEPVVILEAAKPTDSPATTAPVSGPATGKPAPSDAAGTPPAATAAKPANDANTGDAVPAPKPQDPATKAQ